MRFFSSPPIDLLRGRGCIQPVDPRVLRSIIGAEEPSFNVLSLRSGKSTVAILSSKTTGFPIWAYVDQNAEFQIWLYLAVPEIPILSVSSTPERWTNVSRYDAQSADAADATLIETVDVSKGGVLRSGNSLFASDALGISEVELDVMTPIVRVKAAKGLARTLFTPQDIFNSVATKFGLTADESKGLPTPPPTPVAPVTPALPASKPAPSSSPNWLAIGGVAALAVVTVGILGGHLAESATRNQP